MLTGNVVFNGNAKNALLLEYNSADKEIFQKDCLIYAEQLTNEVALFAIKIHAVGLLTCSSSFATHGANILRSYFDGNHCHFLWITNIERSELERCMGKRISIVNGKIYFPMHEKYDSFVQDIVFNPIKNRTKMDYNVSKRKMDVCYWPHRKYDNFTFSIMKNGLEKNLEWLFCEKNEITLDSEGYIWFLDSVPLQKIIDKARDYEASKKYLERQVKVYCKIVSDISCHMTLSKCVDLLIEYFSVFILYHNTYEYVLLDIYHWIESAYGAGFAIESVNKFLFCCVDEWMLNNSLALEKNKSLFAGEPLTPIPDFSIYEDINKKVQDISNFFEQTGKFAFYEKNKKRIHYWIKVFVAKEWKFVINKILFTRCGKIIREFCMEHNWSLNEIKNTRVETVLGVVRDINEYV